MKIDYTVETNKNFDETVAEIEAQTAKAGFKVLHVHDVQATLAAKDIKREPLKIIEICNAKKANEVLEKDIKIGLMLPCKINVYTQDSQTYISTMLPTIMSKIFEDVDLGSLPKEVEQIIIDIVDKSK